MKTHPVVRAVLVGMVVVGLFMSIWGCGSGSSGTVSNPLGAGGGSGNLTGRVLVPEDLAVPSLRLEPMAASRLPNAVSGASRPVADAEVWLEDMPSIRGRSNATGSYTLSGVPGGEHRVVAKITGSSPDTVFKMISAPVLVAENAPAAPVDDLNLARASNRVSGILRDAEGIPLPAGTVMTLWGETFTVGEGGRFTTPPLPDGVVFEEIKVQPTAKSEAMSFTAPFIADAAPPEIEIMVPQQGTHGNQAPVVFLDSRKGGVPCSEILPGDSLTFIASASDADPGDVERLSIVWEPDK